MSTFTVTAVSQGAITNVTVNNAGTGYSVGSTVTFAGPVHAHPPNLIEIRNSNSEPIMSITHTGEVVWHQHQPSKAAQQFLQALKGAIDGESVKNGARQRSYIKGLERCLTLLKTMTKEQLESHLTREIQHRQEQMCWTVLMDSLDDSTLNQP